MTLAISTYASDPTRSIVASALGVLPSSLDARFQLANASLIGTSDSIPIGIPIGVTPTLMPSSYYIEDFTATLP